MNASVKLLLIVREPVTRAISDYTQLRSHSATPSSSTQQSPQQQRTFEQLALRADGSVNAAYKPLAVSLYHTFTHRWLEVMWPFLYPLYVVLVIVVCRFNKLLNVPGISTAPVTRSKRRPPDRRPRVTASEDRTVPGPGAPHHET